MKLHRVLSGALAFLSLSTAALSQDIPKVQGDDDPAFHPQMYAVEVPPSEDRGNIDAVQIETFSMTGAHNACEEIRGEEPVEELNLKAGVTLACVVPELPGIPMKVIIPNPCLFNESFADLICHEFGHVTRLRRDGNDTHEGYQKRTLPTKDEE